MLTDEDALRAAGSPEELERVIESNHAFILRSASKAARRYVSRSDDEWSVALSAFVEAVGIYNESKGHFPPFADLVIGRRVRDLLRSQARHAPEQSMPPSVFAGTESDGVAPLAQASYEDCSELRLEIEALSGLLSVYGIRFAELVKGSPKAGKTRAACANAVRFLLGAPEKTAFMRRTRSLPLAEISKQTGVPRKILERHRKYIIAVVEILDGDYPGIADYLRFMKDETP